MPYVTKFGLQNFRSLKDYTEFELAPITVLVGANSAGKSSLAKALLLADDNLFRKPWKKLGFSGKKHKLGTFELAKNYEKEESTFKFSFVLDFSKTVTAEGHSALRQFIFGDKVRCNITFKPQGREDGQISEVKLICASQEIFQIILDPDDENIESIVKTNYSWFLERLRSLLQSLGTDERHYLKRKSSNDSIERTDVSGFGKDMFVKLLIMREWGDKQSLLPHFLKLETTILQERILDGPDAEDVRKQHFLKILEDTLLQKLSNARAFPSGYGQISSSIGLAMETCQDILQEYFDIFSNDQRSGNNGAFIGSHKVEKIFEELTFESEVKELLGEYLQDLVKSETFTFFRAVGESVKAILNTISHFNLSHLDANRAIPQRLYVDGQSENVFVELLRSIRKQPLSEKKKEFLNFWLQEFNIADEVKISGREGIVSEISLEKNGREIALADLGYGISQVLPILLHISSYGKFIDARDDNPSRSLVIIEEPEANLHPRLQMKLADMLMDATQKLEVQFLIETHSDHLLDGLRQLQPLEDGAPAVKLYYFKENEGEHSSSVMDIPIEAEQHIREMDDFYSEYRQNLQLIALRAKKSKLPLIVTEGKTDWKHMKKALEKFQMADLYEDLRIEFLEFEDLKMGSSILRKFCESQAIIQQERPIICIFDRDEPSITSAMGGTSDSAFKSHGNDVYSFCIPVPNDREEEDRLCIELYYKDQDLKTLDRNGRRIYRSNEFNNKSGKLKEDPIISVGNQGYLSNHPIIDCDVFDADSKNIALPKSKFSEYVYHDEKGFENFDIGSFRLIFDVIQEIL